MKDIYITIVFRNLHITFVTAYTYLYTPQIYLVFQGVLTHKVHRDKGLNVNIGWHNTTTRYKSPK